MRHFTDCWTRPATTLLPSGSSSESYPTTAALEELTQELSRNLQMSSQTLMEKTPVWANGCVLSTAQCLAACFHYVSFLTHRLELLLIYLILLFLPSSV